MPKKIMVIDDDPIIVSYLETLFQDNGYETCTASDGLQAMEVVQRERPDLITLDLEMPNEWGSRFYRKLTKDAELRKIPIIVITGLAGQHAVKDAIAYIHKPFDRDKLLGIVKQAIG
ncbi:DVU0259 family response regulator domain-containing protein [Desulfatirhabdium butyrativorans]|uniref:DVU0259 family response regulator domain-containing protein n=1 Tax=Desulfatirhabdium butyrativorans TaxID=340467 RepID=UPI000416694F|nr:response regulator [Desulfatirhabdium butyrativorans]